MRTGCVCHKLYHVRTSVGVTSAARWDIIPAHKATKELLSMCCSELELRQQPLGFDSSGTHRIATVSQATTFLLQCVLTIRPSECSPDCSWLELVDGAMYDWAAKVRCWCRYLLTCPHHTLGLPTAWVKRKSEWFELGGLIFGAR